jgi:opacity protein-like surface antigen
MIIMKLNKTITSIVTATLLSTSLFAGANNYIGVKYGALSTDKSVFGKEDGTNTTYKLLKYDEVKLTGLEYQLLRNLNSNFMMWGMGAEVMFNDGNFLEGGTAAVDFKLGAHYKELNVYGLVGYGLQSLSSYTVATGLIYGVGINYNIFKHMGVKVEYRTQDLETTDNDALTANQSYTLSGVLAGISYKF